MRKDQILKICLNIENKGSNQFKVKFKNKKCKEEKAKLISLKFSWKQSSK